MAVTQRLSSGHYYGWYLISMLMISLPRISATRDEDEMWVCARRRASPPKCIGKYFLMMPVASSFKFMRQCDMRVIIYNYHHHLDSDMN